MAAMASTDENIFVDAAACGDLDGVKELLADPKITAAQVNAIDKDGRSAFHYSCLNDDVKLLKVLIVDPRCDVLLRTPRGDSGLSLAALYASLEALKVLFKDPRTSGLIDAQNEYGETALHLCAGSGDKGAKKTAKKLLEAGASMLVTDKWLRGPIDVAHENGENPLVEVFNEYLETCDAGLRAKIEAQTAAFKADKEKTPAINAEVVTKRTNMFAGGALGSALKGLKKTVVKEKHMFSKTEGRIGSGRRKSKGEPKDAKSQGKILSKMIDFPGDVQEITLHLANSEVDPAGKDAFGLTALHKFASWNKVELIEMLMEKLDADQINMQDADGKTALHWACEMASVAAVSTLIANPKLDQSIKDSKGRTALDIVRSGSGPVIARLLKALGEEK